MIFFVIIIRFFEIFYIICKLNFSNLQKNRCVKLLANFLVKNSLINVIIVIIVYVIILCVAYSLFILNKYFSIIIGGTVIVHFFKLF